MKNHVLYYRLVPDGDISINQMRARLAQRLVDKIREGYAPQYRNNLQFRQADTSSRPGEEDIIIEHKGSPFNRVILEFYGSQGHLKFHIRQSVRDGLVTTERLCEILDSMPDIAIKDDSTS